MRATVEKWVAEGVLPHCLFSGVQGSGKTSLAKLLLRTLDIPAEDVLVINASRERQIDALQTRIVNFVEGWALGPSGVKYVLLDECLHEDECIRLADGSTAALKSLPDLEPFAVLSFNMETGAVESDIGLVISRREAEVFEVSLADGRVVRTTLDHPFLVKNAEGSIERRELRHLKIGDRIITCDGTAEDI
jgi:DNA polymerase III delta prime subunit